MNWLEMTGARTLPANFGPMKDCNAHARFTGPCGDTMEFWLLLDELQILRTTFTTDGCMTSIACGSVAAKLSQGKTLEEAMGIKPQEILDVLGDGRNEETDHCALLATRTMGMALGDYREAWQKAKGSCGGCEETCCEGCTQGEGKASKRPDGSDRIKRRILVLSGKGGVGKSTVATNLAMEFAAQGLKTGLLDVDLHGPSVPKLLGVESFHMQSEEGMLIPLELGPLKVMSIGFALEADQAAIWRGPMKAGVVDQFVRRTRWEDLDVLVVDCPPGTGDEHLSLVQSLERVDGAVIVTTPQELSTLDAQKAITFCRTMKIPVLGVIENMSGLDCPSCGVSIPVFSMHGGKRMASAFSVPFLGRIPLESGIAEAGDDGRSNLRGSSDSPAAKAFHLVFEKLTESLEGQPVS